LFVKGSRLISLFVAMFICLAFVQAPHAEAQLAASALATDQPIYPIWKAGGTVNVNASRLQSNATYSLWLQRPTDSATRIVASPFTAGSMNFTIVPIGISPSDPAGTYLISLSRSGTTDTREAVAHFGVFGVDRSSYARTEQAVVVGGGFTPSSTVTISFGDSSNSVPGFPTSVRSGSNGEFQYSFRVPPSTPVGLLVVSVTGTGYDAGNSVSVSSPISVTRTSVRMRIATEPSETVERTATTSMYYTITYPDGSPATTIANNSTKPSITRSTDGVIMSIVPLLLSDSTRGTWSASWVPPFDANLTTYHFTVDPTTFDDSYGNLGSGDSIPSGDFRVLTAKTDVTFQVESPVQRSQYLNITLNANYHDGTQFVNVTQLIATMTTASGGPIELFPIYNSTLGKFQTQTRIPENAVLGNWRLVASVKDSFGNTATGSRGVNVVNAVLGISGNVPQTVERTMPIPVDVRITYPDGTLVNSTAVPLGFNATITIGNQTISVSMLYIPTSQAWIGLYPIPENATLGTYSISLTIEDAFGNGGEFSTTTTVVIARFRFNFAQTSSKVDPLALVNIPVFVSYPNGTDLTSNIGVVNAAFTNSSGTFTLPMIYNATDHSWRLIFLAPNPGLTFGVTLKLSFEAGDTFGNRGSVPDAYELAIGAGTQTLILAAIIGAVVPIALVAWAVFAITARRRKYKP